MFPGTSPSLDRGAIARYMVPMLPLLLLTSFALAADLPGDDAPWETLGTSPVKVQCARVSGVPWCRSTGVVGAPIDQVYDALLNMAYNAALFDSVVTIEVVAEDTLHVVLDYPAPLDDRDYVARYTYRIEGENRVVRWVPVVSAAAPETSAAVRLPRFAGEWRLEPREGATWVRYTWHAEINGSFPTFGYNTAWKRSGFEALRDLARTQKATLSAAE